VVAAGTVVAGVLAGVDTGAGAEVLAGAFVSAAAGAGAGVLAGVDTGAGARAGAGDVHQISDEQLPWAVMPEPGPSHTVSM